MAVAEVTLHEFEIREGLLPPVCLRCGGPATVRVTQTFARTSFPSILPTRFTAALPMCDRHRSHWKLLHWLRNVGYPAFLAAVAVFFFALIFLVPWTLPPDMSGGLLVILTLFSIMGLTFAMPIVCFFSIRAIRIQGDAITLTRVSDRFAEALDRERSETNRAQRPTGLPHQKTDVRFQA